MSGSWSRVIRAEPEKGQAEPEREKPSIEPAHEEYFRPYVVASRDRIMNVRWMRGSLRAGSEAWRNLFRKCLPYRIVTIVPLRVNKSAVALGI